MITDFDVYCAFRRAQANSKGTGFKLPKDWDKFKTTRMTDGNYDCLSRMTMYFNTTYSNVDMDEYMKCGFELWKGFTYRQFLNPKVLEHYIHKDKVKKRRLASTKEEIDNSFAFIRAYLSEKPDRPGYEALQSFAKFRTGEVRDIVTLYNKGKIDSMTFIYCVYKKYIILSDDERALTPYIVQRYRELVQNMMEVIDFIKEKATEINQ